MTRVLGTVFAAWLLVGCSRTTTPPAPEGIRPEVVQFLSPWKPGGGMSLYLGIDPAKKPHLIEPSITNFRTILKGQFHRHNVPPDAYAAAAFIAVGDTPKDTQVVYATSIEGQLVVRRGYIVPGFGPPVEWTNVILSGQADGL